MSDTQTDASTAQPTDSHTVDDRSVREYVEYLALALLVVFAVLSAFQFYARASATIAAFVSESYRPVFAALFNLVVLLACTGGIALILERWFDA
jgi:hypothetical protein